MGALNFYMRDIYGNTGYMDSRMQTVPEAADQMALVDSQEAAEEHQVRHDPRTAKNIIIGIVAIIVIMILFSLK